MCLTLLLVACQSEPPETPGTMDPVPTASVGTLDTYPAMASDHVRPRHVAVWLPPDYDSTRAAGYPVLYMHDGQNLFDPEAANFGVEWQVDETLARLIDDGTIPPTIVVGVYSTPLRTQEYLPAKPFHRQPDAVVAALKRDLAPDHGSPEVRSDAYLRFLTQELKPFVDATYPTAPEMESTFIAGSSMGGLISLYALTESPDVFAGAACVSTHWALARSRDDLRFTEAFRTYLAERIDTLQSKRLYFDYGTETLDRLYAPHQQHIDALLEAHATDSTRWTTRTFEGAKHHESSWAARFDQIATFLLSE